MKVKSLSRVQLFATPWTAAHQAPPSMGFSRQEYWSGVPLPSLMHTLLSHYSLCAVSISGLLSASPPFFPKPKVLPTLSLKWCMCDTRTFMLNVSPSSRQWSLMSLVPGSGFMEDNFSMDQGGGAVWWFKLITFMVVNFYCHYISSASDHQAWLGTPVLHHLQANLTHDSRSSCSSIDLLYMMHIAAPLAGPGSKDFRCDKPHLILTANAWRVPSLSVFYMWANRSVERQSAKCALLNGTALVTCFQSLFSSIIHGLHMTLKSENSRIEIRI